MEKYIFTKANRLLRVKQNQIKMVQKRGYTLNETEKILLQYDYRSGDDTKKFFDYYDKISKSQNITFFDSLGITYNRNIDEENEYLQVIFLVDTSADRIKYLIETIEQNRAVTPIKNIILIIDDKANKLMNRLDQIPGITFNIFLYDELIINIMSNSKMPLIELLTPKEQEHFFINNPSVLPTNMPMMCIDDPAVKYIGGRIGQVIKILRTNYHSYTASRTSLTYKIISDKLVNTKKFPIFE